MRVTSKGQVTIPKSVRDKAGIGPGCEVDFDVRGEVVTLRRVAPGARRKSRGQRIVEGLRGTASRNRHLSTDEIMQLLRGDD